MMLVWKVWVKTCIWKPQVRAQMRALQGPMAPVYFKKHVTSNVNVAEELVNMIQTQRAYEITAMTSDQMLQRLTQL